MNGRTRRAFYMDLTEHFLRLAIRRDISEVQGEAVQEWHRNTTKWLNENCTTEERALIRDFYTYNQTVSKCSNYKIVAQIEELAARFSADLGLR